jgi:hypothetical protein
MEAVYDPTFNPIDRLAAIGIVAESVPVALCNIIRPKNGKKSTQRLNSR